MHAKNNAAKKGVVLGLTVSAFWFLIFAALSVAFYYGVKLMQDPDEDFDPGDTLTVSSTSCDIYRLISFDYIYSLTSFWYLQFNIFWYLQFSIFWYQHLVISTFFTGAPKSDKKKVTPLLGFCLQVFLGVMIGSMSLGHAFPTLEVIANARGAATKVFSIIEQKSKINYEQEGGKKLEKMEGNITFRGVHFRYPARPNIPVSRIASGKSIVNQSVFKSARKFCKVCNIFLREDLSL